MSRHRDIRNLDYDEEYDEAYDDTVYGHSVDDHEYGVSPSTEQYLFSAKGEISCGFGAYFPGTEKIEEEDDSVDNEIGSTRRDSSSSERPRLSSEDEVRLHSVLEEIRNVVGDHFSETELTQTVLENKYDFEASLNAVLNQNCDGKKRKEATKTSKVKRERVVPTKQSDIKPISIISTPVIVKTPARSVVMGFEPQENGVDSNDKDEEADNGEPIPAQPLEKESAPATPRPPAKVRDKEVDVLKMYAEHRETGKVLLNLVVVGHVDAGKSTLMGHLLYLQGNVAQRTMHKYEHESKKLGKQSFMYAWVLDDTEEERSRGITVDVAQRSFETETKSITLLDAPGHRDFIPNMITGAARADVGILVVDASRGGFEAGFESGGQTREHAILVRSLGVSELVVCINKLDMVDWSSERFEEIQTSLRQFLKTVGFKDSDIQYVPCSGLTGENLIVTSKDKALNSWYKGCTLLQAIDQLKVPERAVTKPIRFCISDVYKGQGSSMCVAGRLETGYTQNGDRLMLMPQAEMLSVKGVQVDYSEPGFAFAGDHVTMNVGGIDPNMMHVGDFLCDPLDPIAQALRIEARIVVFNITVPIIKGSQFDFHYQSVSEIARVRKLISQLHKSTGQVIKQRPRALVKNSTAVVELEFSRPLCLEEYKNYKELGRFMLRNNGVTVAAGMVTQVIKNVKS